MRILAIAGAALALVSIAGCTPNENAAVRQEVRGVRQTLDRASEDAQRRAADAALEGRVKSALMTRKGLDGDNINVDAKGTNVVLKGDVQTREQADLAERVAIETNGVESVDNQLMLRIPAKSTGPSELPGPMPPR
jgi:osmotically-inducible protein OsmY